MGTGDIYVFDSAIKRNCRIHAQCYIMLHVIIIVLSIIYFCFVPTGQGHKINSVPSPWLHPSCQLHPDTQDVLTIPQPHRTIPIRHFQTPPWKIFCAAFGGSQFIWNGHTSVLLKSLQGVQVDLNMAAVPFGMQF